MKKRIALLTATVAAVAISGCSKSEVASTTEATTANVTTTAEETTTTAEETTAEETTTVEDTTEEATTETAVETGDVMSYDEFMAAQVETEVTVITYVQAKQSWWDNTATVYTQTEDGAFFIYGMACSEEDYEKLVPGTEIMVTGYKAEWSGEIEITDATFAFTETGNEYIAEAVDVTDYLGAEELPEYMNQFVCFNNMVVEAAGQTEDGEEVAWLYKWDGSGSEGDDLYFKVSDGNAEFTFTVESYLCGADTDVYKAVKELKVGDVVNMEGFLYWYEGPNPHITGVEVAGVMVDHEDFMNAPDDAYVAFAGYVQDAQSWWDDKATFYIMDNYGGYFAYNVACSEELYDAIMVNPGAAVVVFGYKTEWSGEIEVVDATIRYLQGVPATVFEAKDVTEYLGTDELINYMNMKVAFTDLEVAASKDADGNEVAFLYKWDGSGNEGDDLYFNVTDGTNTYNFTVESYLRGADTDVYKTVQGFNVGDKVDLEGFLYWYEGANPHITDAVVK